MRSNQSNFRHDDIYTFIWSTGEHKPLADSVARGAGQPLRHLLGVQQVRFPGKSLCFSCNSVRKSSMVFSADMRRLSSA